MDNVPARAAGALWTTPGTSTEAQKPAPAIAGAGFRSWLPGRAYSQRVANENPTAMNAMPTMRFFWSRSLKTGTLEVSWAIA